MEFTINDALKKGVEAHKAGKIQEADRFYTAILKVQPKHPDANHNLGVLAVGVGKTEQALPLFKNALETNPSVAQYWLSFIDAFIKLGKTDDAKRLLNQAKARGFENATFDQLEKQLNGPNFEDIKEPTQEALQPIINLYNQGLYQQVLEQVTDLLQKFSRSVTLYYIKGAAHSRLSQFESAINSYKTALKINPDFAGAYLNMGIALKEQGDFEGAIASYKRALKISPDFAEAHNNLGVVLEDLGRLRGAEAGFREAIRLNPDFAIAYSNLGNALKKFGRLQEAEAGCREAIRLNPDFAEAHSILGAVLKDLGKLQEAEAGFREAIRLNPDFAEARSNLLFTLNYVESVSTGKALEEAKQYGVMVSAKAVPKFSSWHSNPGSEKLRIGFVSGDFKNHPVGYFIEGLINYLAKRQFDLVAFPTVPKEDELTSRIKPFFQEWLPIYGKNNRNAATLIHDKKIDILIDLAGHSAHNRLPVFSYKPAPIQITWLGYFATTGLPEMDYFIGDPYMSPENEHHHFTEKVWNLQETWLCLTPPDPSITISPPPLLKNGYITFGCFGHLSKMNKEVIKLWATILQRILNSKLFLKAKQLSDAKVIADVQHQFAKYGITADRLIFEGPSSRDEYLKAYNQIDMVLDTFPYPGGTTSSEALWMGVPVLTLKGDRFLSHIGESIAHNSYRTEWIAADKNDYINKAVSFSSDPQLLARIRAEQREMILQAPLFDTKSFTRNFEKALWSMFKRP